MEKIFYHGYFYSKNQKCYFVDLFQLFVVYQTHSKGRVVLVEAGNNLTHKELFGIFG